MKKLDKDFDLTTTLIIIYLGLVTISIALYALIQIYVDDEATASSLLGWSATIFGTIALLYTFNSWRDQKGSEVIANECTEINTNLSISYDDFLYICKYPFYTDRDSAIKALSDLEIKLDKIKRELYFIRSSMIDDNLESIFDPFLDKQKEFYIKLKICLIDNKEITSYLHEIQKVKEECLFPYNKLLNELISILRPYSLYKKNIKFKK